MAWVRSLLSFGFLARRHDSGLGSAGQARKAAAFASDLVDDSRYARLPPVSPDLVMAMADRLRAPLVGITSILDQSAGEGPGSGEGLGQARQEAVRLLELVSGLTEYARIQDGTAVLHAEHFNLASTVESVTNALSSLAESKNISVEVLVPIIEMRNDLKVMHQVLFLCLNCILLLPKVRRVRIEAESDVHLVKLTLAHDGGFLSPGSVDSGNADGLELNLAAWFCIALGGSLHVGKGPDGQIVSLDLPRAMSFGPREAALGQYGRYRTPGSGSDQGIPTTRIPEPGLASAPAPGLLGRKGRVLIIDDEPVSLFALKKRMESAGWVVHAMVSVVEAIALVEAGEEYTVIITDSKMPEMSGFDFCTRIRRKYGKEVLPVLLMLDSGHSSVIDRAFRSGANDYLIRPVSGIELEARIKTHVDLSASLKRELDHQARMAEADKYRTLAMLTAGVAHEINTPNNATLRNIPILREIWLELSEALSRLYEAEGSFNVRGYDYTDLRYELPAMLDDVYMGAQHIRKIVTDLKDYARGPSPLEGSAAPTDVNQAILYAHRLLKHSITLGTNHFSHDLAPDLPPVRADRLKLTQVIVNILENALQSLPSPEGSIQVRSFIEAGPGLEGTDPEVPGDSLPWVCIRVTDNGRGMDEATLASVFDPFFTTKRERGGTGLGMPVALGIIRELGGSIELRSSINTGTSVLVRIPSCPDCFGGSHDA